MSIDDISTLARIHSAAKAEFMEKGYRSSSLRSIVKAAGVTTGAFYGYYAGKQELFAALVDEEYRYIIGACNAGSRRVLRSAGKQYLRGIFQFF